MTEQDEAVNAEYWALWEAEYQQRLEAVTDHEAHCQGQCYDA